VSKITDGSSSGSSLEGKRDPYAQLYTGHVDDKKANEADSVKTTMIMRSVANPRRTTLAHLKDADELTVLPPAERTETGKPVAGLPAQTANPRRTVLMDAPVG
jgi:hypothetical protein